MDPLITLKGSLRSLKLWRAEGLWALMAGLGVVAFPSTAWGQAVTEPGADVAPLAIGQTFTMHSKALDETRTINVYLPVPYTADSAARLPVLYMPDGGVGEDFLHIAGLVQVSVGNRTMRPFILVGIENTARRRDLTGPTKVASDSQIAPVVGGSAAFRRFIRDELMPEIRSRYRSTDEAAIVGESLAGLFIVETLFLEPDLFDTYIAFDPSLWWNGGALVPYARDHMDDIAGRTLYLAASRDDVDGLTQRLADELKSAPSSTRWHYRPMPEERHATIYHPAALGAFRWAFGVADSVDSGE